jgi:hypothetical protein
MHDPEQSDAPRPIRNAFASEFLDSFKLEDEPSSSAEADTAGPWYVM